MIVLRPEFNCVAEKFASTALHPIAFSCLKVTDVRVVGVRRVPQYRISVISSFSRLASSVIVNFPVFASISSGKCERSSSLSSSRIAWMIRGFVLLAKSDGVML